MAVAIGALLLLLILGGTAIAGVPITIPEIDPGSMASAVALLVAGGVLVAERMRCKFNAP
jgi:hypothetical protein